jgi:two-component system, sensor histidine kinase ChiS
MCRRQWSSPYLSRSIALCAFFALMGCSEPTTIKAPGLSNGVADLRLFDFSKGTSLSLSGQWDFLPGSVDIAYDDFKRSATTLRMVPDLWNGAEAGGTRGHGCGTYHLTLLLPDNAPPLALHYQTASTSFSIEVQGKEVARNGIPSADPGKARPAYRPGFAKLEGARGRVEIMVRVSNYVYRSGGLWYPIVIGPARQVEATHLSELGMAVSQVTALTVMGLILFLIFGLRGREKAILFSALFAMIICLRVLVSGEYLLTLFWPDIPFGLLVRLEYLTVFLPFPTVTAFFTSLLPQMMGRRLKRLCLIPPFVFTLFVFIFPVDLLTRTIFFYYGFVALNIIIGVSALLRLMIREFDFERSVLFFGTLFLALCAINDILYNSFVIATGNLAPWSFAIFVAIQVVILVKRLTGEFAEAEELVDKKELLIKEIHHRVKNNLQIVASLISLQSNRVKDGETREVFAALRNRIVSMSLVHEKLYGGVSAKSLDLGDYAHDLIKLLVAKDAIEEGKVNLHFKSQAIHVAADACVDLGLVLTEIVANSMKHALLPKGGGELRVEISRVKDRVAIVVEDDGPGFPPGFDPSGMTGLGYKLITSLLSRNGGGMTILPGRGGRVRAEIRYEEPGSPAQDPLL